MQYYKKEEDVDGSVKFIPVNIEEEITIQGRTLKDIYEILIALDFEKEQNIKFTMENLGKIVDILRKEQEKSMTSAFLDLQNRYKG